MIRPMTKRRVALVALHFSEYSINLALALAAEWEVLLVLYRDNAEGELGMAWRDCVGDSSAKIIVLDRPAGVASILMNTRTLVSQVRRFSPDILHCQEDLRDELVLSLFFLRRFPIVLTVHDPTTHSGADSKRFRFSRFRLYRHWVRSNATAAIAHGRLLASELGRVSPNLAGHVASLPHGPLGACSDVELHSFPKEVRLLFFGRIHEYKGLRYFIEAIIQLRSKGYAVTGVVAGRGGDLDRHRAHMEAAGGFEILDWRIPAADVLRLFINATAVIVPYVDGTQSGVAAMALGFGRPVVATSVGSIPELVRNGVNGLLVPPADAAALTAAIESIISNADTLEKLAHGARQLRCGELSWAAIAHRTIDFYESLLGPQN